ncbi:hypothetical protein DF186_25900, partial [Enterococcus hirae]
GLFISFLNQDRTWRKEMNKGRLLTMKEVLELIPYSQPHIYRLIKEGKFPKQIRLGPNKVAWFEADILKWLEDKIEG